MLSKQRSASKLINARKLQIRKFLGSFRCRKSANFLGVTVRKSRIQTLLLICKSKIRKFLQNTALLCLKNSPAKSPFLTIFFMYKFEWEHYMLYF
jgi:hypothetical protein